MRKWRELNRRLTEMEGKIIDLNSLLKLHRIEMIGDLAFLKTHVAKACPSKEQLAEINRSIVNGEPT